MAAVTGSVSNVQSVAQFDDAVARDSTLSVTYFYAEFHDACRPNGQLDVVLRQLATLYPRVRFLKVAAEELPDLSDRFLVTVVPTFVIAQGSVVLEKLEGTNVAVLAKRVDVLNSRVVHTTTTSTSAANETLSKPLDGTRQDRLAKLLYAAPVMLFLKGTPSEPKCDASRDVVVLLNEEEIAFSTFDVLQDQDVQEGLKLVSKSSMFPQLYVNSSFIGGLEVLKEIKAKGSIADHIGVTKKLEPTDAAFQASLRALVNSAPVLLFMKGTPSDPKCGFSKKTVQLLRDHEIAFSYFDILSDAQVRQGLKQFANWPTYPQLYVKGKLVGGLDILNEMAEDGDLSEQLGVEKKTKKENKYEQLINRARVMIFIKGTPQQPQCGFSRKLVDILNSEGFKYDSFDILTDDSVRQGLKKYSNWPTFPQLYVKGELVGGLDIVQQMQEDGELAELKE
uniref:Glutaredoxin domain-containing protein n=1 Tax=Hyaloperonospora arabidopsidis (strain Emoy2) TaxID=559515 RepID=M4BD96_HYAAE